MNFSKQGTTSVKVHHAPGGQSSFSLGWDEPVKPITKPVLQNAQQPTVQTSMQAAGGKGKTDPAQQQPAGKTSVKVNNPPGGKSNFIFG
jgi:hypothetical protein